MTFAVDWALKTNSLSGVILNNNTYVRKDITACAKATQLVQTSLVWKLRAMKITSFFCFCYKDFKLRCIALLYTSAVIRVPTHSQQRFFLMSRSIGSMEKTTSKLTLEPRVQKYCCNQNTLHDKRSNPYFLLFVFKVLRLWKINNIDESVYVRVCLCVCPSQAIPLILLKSLPSSNSARWLFQICKCYIC